MLELPKLLNWEEIDGEKRWTYPLKITFNYQPIKAVTITSYYQTKPGREMITNELIWNMLQTKLNEEVLRPIKNYQGNKKPYKWEEFYQGRKFRLIFWFKDHTPNHLWIRNIFPIN